MDRNVSPVQNLVSTMAESLAARGARVPTGDVESWAFAVHSALANPGRAFHNHEHVVEMCDAADPLESLAALYHDCVYIQVDHGPPRSMAQLLSTMIAIGGQSFVILPAANGGPCKLALEVFGRHVGERLELFDGVNELASCLLAMATIGSVLSREDCIAICACIEQTIPFRIGAADKLAARLEGLGITGELRDEMLGRAVHLGNRDVENFAEERPEVFLDNTWKLLPESTPTLHSPMVYSVRDYRTALLKMERFLSDLSPERVFHRWGSQPTAELHAALIARARSNITLAVRYLRAKLYSIAIVEAIAFSTGGDVPIDYFMGGLKSPRRPQMRRIEPFLPHVANADGIDPILQRLLAEGRASESSFDTSASPLAAFLHGGFGESVLDAGVAAARAWWDGNSTALAFLKAQPPIAVAGIARAAAEIMPMRRDELLALARTAG